MRIDYGTFPLDIRWDDPDPAFTVARCEKALLAFSPSFKRHECRSERPYTVNISGLSDLRVSNC